MRRGLIASAGVVVVALACAAVFGRPIMGPYLAAWLVFLSLPVGALPLVLGSELAGQGGSAQNGFLRWMLVLMPAAALLGLPVLLATHSLYPWAGHPGHGFAGAWFKPAWFGLRGVVYLAVWTWLCLSALWPPERRVRVGFCSFGLALHLVIGTLAAADWVASLSPGLNAAGFGLLLMTVQAGIALSVSLLLVRVAPPSAPVLLALAAGLWAFLHVIQYLVIWSADKPAEIVWYLHRGNTLGTLAVWLGVSGLAASLALLGAGAPRRFVPAAAALILVAHIVEIFWLVTPSLRGFFTISFLDIAVIIGMAGLAWVSIRAWRPAQVAA